MDPERAVIAAALLLVVLGAYLAAVRAFYRLRSPRPELEWVPTPDGTRLAVHRRRPAVRRFVEPVLLCHGLAANHVNFDFDPPHSLAHVLAAAGFEVFSVDWRGAGASQARRPWQRYLYDADDLIAQDGPALLAHALERTGARRAFWVGHSLGALVGYGVLGGPHGSGISGMCAIGAPVFFRYTGWVWRLSRLALWLAWPLAFRQRLLSIGLAPFLGRVRSRSPRFSSTRRPSLLRCCGGCTATWSPAWATGSCGSSATGAVTTRSAAATGRSTTGPACV